METRVRFASTLSAMFASLGVRMAEGADAYAVATAFVRCDSSSSFKAREFLKLTKDEYKRLVTEVATFLEHDARANSERESMTARNAELAMLRSLMWFETACQRGCLLDKPDLGAVHSDPLDEFRLLRALEMLMRELLRSLHDDAETVRARIKVILPAEAADALERTPQDPIAGLYLKDLVRLYVNVAEWEHIDPIYRESAYLRLLRDRRLTAESFLEDIRRFRNDVAHCRPLTSVQHALLTFYYEELVEPVRDAYSTGRSSVDPSAYEGSRTPEEFAAYTRQALHEAAQESRASSRLARFSLSISIFLLIAAVPMLWPVLRLRLDPAQAYLDTLKADSAQHGALAVQACANGDRAALARLSAEPGASHALSGDNSSAIDYAITLMTLRDPAKLRQCLPELKAMGWDPNTVSGNTVGNLLSSSGSGSLPEGYNSYLLGHPDGLVPGKPSTAPELRCPPLVLAVWRGDIELVSAMVAVGANPDTNCIIDAIWLDGRNDVKLSSARAEAQRMNRADLLQALVRNESR